MDMKETIVFKGMFRNVYVEALLLKVQTLSLYIKKPCDNESQKKPIICKNYFKNTKKKKKIIYRWKLISNYSLLHM